MVPVYIVCALFFFSVCCVGDDAGLDNLQLQNTGVHKS